MKDRIVEFDIMKGILIILMVYCHTGFYSESNFINLFHMPVFFIISGFFIKNNISNTFFDIKKFVFSKIKQLYIPFVISNLFFCIFNNVFCKIGFYPEEFYKSFSNILVDCVKIFLFSKITRFGGATWFLRSLFFASILYIVIDVVIKKIKNKEFCHFFLSFLLLCILFILKSKSLIKNTSIYYLLSTTILGYNGISFGRIIKFYYSKIITIPNIIKVITLICAFFILLFLSNYGVIAVNSGSFVNPLFYEICSIFGFVFCFICSYFLKKIRISFLILIGQNTLPILMIHFFSFSILNYLIVISKNMPMNTIASFPTLYMLTKESVVLRLVYLLGGIYIPIFLTFIKKYIREKMS